MPVNPYEPDGASPLSGVSVSCVKMDGERSEAVRPPLAPTTREAQSLGHSRERMWSDGAHLLLPCSGADGF